MGVQIPLSRNVFISLGYVPRSGIAGECGSYRFDFLRKFILFAIVAIPVYNPPSPRRCTRVPFSAHRRHHLSLVFLKTTTDRCVAMAHGGLI